MNCIDTMCSTDVNGDTQKIFYNFVHSFTETIKWMMKTETVPYALC